MRRFLPLLILPGIAIIAGWLIGASATQPATLPTGDDIRLAAVIATVKAQGGTVPLHGLYRLSQPITLPDNTILQGDGTAALSWAHDLGPGIAAVQSDLKSAGQSAAAKVYNVTISGPGWNTPLGQLPAQMDGLALGSCAVAQEVTVKGFRAGVRIYADHEHLIDVRSTQNAYGVDWCDHPASASDQLVVGCYLDGNTIASVRVGGDNLIDSTCWVKTHFGGGPYAFLKTDCSDGTASTQGLIHGSEFHECSWEGIGNCAILDQSTGTGPGLDSIVNSRIENAGFSWGANRLTTAPRDWAIDVRRVMGLLINGGTYPFTSGDVGVCQCRVSGQLSLELAGTTLPANLFGSGQTWSQGGMWTSTVLDSTTGLLARPFINLGGAINAGDCLEYNGAWYAVQPWNAADGKGFAGVAINAAPTNGVALVAQRGPCLANCEPCGVVGPVMYPSTQGAVLTPNVANKGGDAIGNSYGNTGAGGGMMTVLLK